MRSFLMCNHFRFAASKTLRFYSKTNYPNLLKVLKTMPKEPKHIAEAQRQRIKIKQKSSRYVPGKVTLQILGTGAKGAPQAVYLFSDQSRYLFNCGEGTQRLAHEHKMKLGRLEHIFITQPVWKNIGGLPGTALTIQDVGVPQITLHGPPGLNEIFTATRRFVVLRDLKIKMAECDETTKFEDNVMTVKYVPLVRKQAVNGINEKDVQVSAPQAEVSTSTRRERRRSRKSSSDRREMEAVEDNTDYYAHEHSSKSSMEMADLLTQSATETLKVKNMSMCYICHLQPRPGTLNLDRCVEKGVPPGPLLGKLKNGEDIILANGTEVKSSDVVEPDDPGPVFIVVDCPLPEYLDSLLLNQELEQHQSQSTDTTCIACLVLHFTPKEVVELPEYKEWIGKFPPSTDHIFINETNSCMGSIAVHRIQHQLNMLSSHFFPLLGDQGTPSTIEECSEDHRSKRVKHAGMEIDKLKINGAEKSNKVSGGLGTLSSYHLRPKKGLDNSFVIKLEPSEYINESMSHEEFPTALRVLKEKLSSKSSATPKEYPKIVFLGTGSCIPNKTRNTSGILLQTSDTCNILMDCGEGTCGQILRFFGAKGDKTLTNIEAVYISHLHADHHIGLIGLLQGRKRAMEKLDCDKGPVYLFAPKQILTWLSFYDRCFESISDEFILVPNGDLVLKENNHPKDEKQQFLADLGISEMNTCLVRHCPNAFGVSIVHKDGYKITYSGDTMPSDKLIELGKQSDILIHEATMEDELANEALIKMHSTTSQAIQVGKDMEAGNVILTHFSQRYAKLPRFNENFDANVCIAFDNMQVKLDELSLVPLLYPALKIMFAEHYEELENKAVKRQRRSEREAWMDRGNVPEKAS